MNKIESDQCHSLILVSYMNLFSAKIFHYCILPRFLSAELSESYILSTCNLKTCCRKYNQANYFWPTKPFRSRKNFEYRTAALEKEGFYKVNVVKTVYKYSGQLLKLVIKLQSKSNL